MALSADGWADNVRLSDIEDRLVSTACGKTLARMSGPILTGASGRPKGWAIGEVGFLEQTGRSGVNSVR
jgi:hypothetical protein